MPTLLITNELTGEKVVTLASGIEGVEQMSGRDEAHAAIFRRQTAGLVAIDGAGTAGERKSHGIAGVLTPPHEAGEMMCGTPHTHYPGAHERCYVHIRRIGRYHCIALAYERHFGR